MKKFKLTALVEVTSHGSGGRGKILVCAYKGVVGRDALTSKIFTNYQIGARLVVSMDYNIEKGKRQIRGVAAFSTPDGYKSVADFHEVYGDIIKAQQNAINEYLARPEVAAKKPAVDGFKVVPFAKEIAENFVAKKLAPVEVEDKWHDAFYVQDEERNAFKMAKALCGEIPAKVMIIGASGYGKTSLPKAFAALNGMKYVRFNVALVRDPEEFFGWRTVDGGDVKFVKSEFTTAITEGNAVVVLDELNRATPEMANALFPILDDDARTVVFGEEIKVGPNVIIVATVNVGYQFVGTFSIDQALLNRMDITLRVSPLPRNVEREILIRRANVTADQADTIVTICSRLRDLTNEGKIIVDASTRTSIRVAKFVANGASYQDAFAWAIINGADNDERKEIIDTVSSVI